LVHALPVGRRTDPTWPALNRRRPRPRRTAPPRQARPLAGRRHRPASRRGRPRRAPVRHGRSRGGPGIPGAGDVGWVGARSPGALRATRHAALRRGPRRGPVAWTAASGAYGTASPPPGGEASGRFRRVRHGVPSSWWWGVWPLPARTARRPMTWTRRASLPRYRGRLRYGRTAATAKERARADRSFTVHRPAGVCSAATARLVRRRRW